ncbi:UDP-glucose 4-epimerase GalE [Dyadobacter sp. LJ419]|uniref:UDP-glucose 4-epimerase n=1 Tax=Dyadobacter chenwenxiniae TaxID=2906456 RepID=A0A9X1PSE6_9BACT|nr:UDP-glucose 4-epimerase GalE [Dyadobacter chenwenxiniae]MCF0064818.1 UDP-glucose 4-epimerase GalE [Dyadobacter chenwenxiniae]
MKILVTGGAGFIGSHTVVELDKAGFEPVIIDNLYNSNPGVLEGIKQITGKDFPFYEIDCNDSEKVRALFEKEKFDGIIHFAAYKAVGESVEKPLNYYENNLISLLVLLRAAQEFKVPNFVFSSSCTVYGQPDAIPVTENTPRKPANSPYGNTKAIGEDIIRDYVYAKSGVKAISLRYFNPIGAHESSLIGELPNGVPSNLVPFITQTAAGLRQSLTVFGSDYDTADGTCVRDFIHVVDLAKAHVKALELLEEQSEPDYYDVFNVGTGEGYTVLELIRTFEEVNGVKLNYSIGPRRPGDVEKIYAQSDKVNNVMKWHAEKTMADALKDAWNWQQKITTQK